MQEPTGPDQCYCLANRRGARYLARLYDRHLAPADLSSSQFSILALLRHKGRMTVAELAKSMVMERTTLVRALQPLKSARWVLSRPAKAQRAMELSLSTAGSRKVEEAAPMWRAAQQAFEAEFGRERASMLRAHLLEVDRRQ